MGSVHDKMCTNGDKLQVVYVTLGQAYGAQPIHLLDLLVCQSLYVYPS